MARGQFLENSREQMLAYMRLNTWEGSTYPVCAQGSTASKIKITNNLTPVQDGIPKTAITAADFTLALPTSYAPGFAEQRFVPANLSQTGQLTAPWPTSVLTVVPVLSWFRLLIVSDGVTLFTLPSFIGLASAAAAPDAPPMPANMICVGDVTVSLASTATFTMGTTAFNAANVTSVFRDLKWPDTGPSSMPLRSGYAALANVQ